jgi:hypothetical protein
VSRRNLGLGLVARETGQPATSSLARLRLTREIEFLPEMQDARLSLLDGDAYKDVWE